MKYRIYRVHRDEIRLDVDNGGHYPSLIAQYFRQDKEWTVLPTGTQKTREQILLIAKCWPDKGQHFTESETTAQFRTF